MNREIKFRAFDKEENLMRTVMKLDWYCNSGCTNLRPSQISGVWEDKTNGKIADKFELMEWTGFKDANGIDIYEGDIIDKKFQWIVAFEDGAFYAKNEYSKAYLLPEIIRKRRIAGCPIEVIGNIYENANLLILKVKN